MANMFDAIDEKKTSLSAKAKAAVIEFFPYIMLILNIAFNIGVRLFKAEISDPFSEDFFSSLFINTMSSSLCYACFVFYAERNRKETLKEYSTNSTVWSTISSRVRLNSFESFIEYCKMQLEREKEERRVAIIANNTAIPISRWQTEYRKLSSTELDKLVLKGEITKAEAKYIKRANGPVNIAPIDPLLILCGVKMNDINDAGRQNVSSLGAVLLRPIPVLALSLFFSIFSGSFIGVSDSSAIFDMIYTAGVIIGSALMGYSKGVNIADRQHDAIKARIAFLERFEKSLLTKEQAQ